MISDRFGAFVEHGRIEVRGATHGPLSGLPFAVKDFFDVAGIPTGAGSPSWLATHEVPTETAPAVQRLLDAGALLVGKTHTDELAWSLFGENTHYGTPINPAAPDRVPGGSSSGSVVAVAGGLVPFAIGSDTGGSVRLPASFCGVIGMRATHGRIPLTGAVPLAPSYDTIGWFARDVDLFARVGAVLLGRPVNPRAGSPRLLIAQDLFEEVDPRTREALAAGMSRLEERFGQASPVDMASGELPEWRETFRVLQASEAWQAHGAWILAVDPQLGPGIRERFAAAARLSNDEIERARRKLAEIRERMAELVPDDAMLILPSAPGIAPLRGSPQQNLEAFRAKAIELLCAAGHAGMPQISLPVASLDGCPLGLSLLAARNNDEMLLKAAGQVLR